MCCASVGAVYQNNDMESYKMQQVLARTKQLDRRVWVRRTCQLVIPQYGGHLGKTQEYKVRFFLIYRKIPKLTWAILLNKLANDFSEGSPSLVPSHMSLTCSICRNLYKIKELVSFHKMEARVCMWLATVFKSRSWLIRRILTS